MPILTKDHLALKFQQNWLEKHPNDVPAASKEDGLDDSLTSLNWLQNLNIMNLGAPTPPASPTPLQETNRELKVNPNSILNVTYVQPPKIDHKIMLADITPSTPSSLDKIDYKTNPYVKPPYSYATLICMAMKESKKTKITLSSIYNWITDNFMYYRMADPSWQNSIRHNLSLNKCFQKVPRRKDEPGKGGFWRVNPEYSDMFVNGVFKKRRGSVQENITPTKRPCKDENSDEPPTKSKKQNGADEHENSLNLKGEITWDSLLNQDIEVNGVRIKTEKIIDDDAYGAASPLIAMSPPSSDTYSDDIDDFFGTDLSSDVSSDGRDEESKILDLSVQGVKIEAPDWWTESMNNSALREFMLSPGHHNSGLHTPIAPSPVPDNDANTAHPWAVDRTDIDDAIAAFDVDNLFDIENIPSPLIS